LTLQKHLTQLYPNVWRLIAPNPSPMTGPGTNTYFVGRDRVVVIDPGPDNADHIAQIQSAVQTLNADAEAVIITHPHADHAGCAEQVATLLGVPLLSFGHPFDHGDEFVVDSVSLVVHHTPGHIYTHICLLLVEQQLLFAGDLIAGQGTVIIIPPDGDMADYIDSLRAMKALAPAAILSGHGPIIDDPQSLLQQYIDHRLMREQQVLHWLAQGLTTAQAIAAQIYADRPEALGIATLQTEAHLTKLRKEGRL
jgi:glyoxylase-like metal-dependent hydrolase (beta-lactamase superfamily II)